MNKITIIKVIIIVIIIILLIWLWHSVYIKHQKGKGNRIIIQETFAVTLHDKTENHISYGKGHDKAFYINGEEAPELKLRRGVFYAFQNYSDEPLYFTEHEEGGEGAPGSLAKNIKGGFRGLAKGTIFFEITDDLPDNFYYQSGKNKSVGAKVRLI